MISVRATVSAVKGALPAPSGNARALWSERRGLLLRLFDDAGNVGHGEASPLPGYSPDDIDRARAALAARPWEALGDFDEHAPIVPQLQHILSQIDVRLPSARFAVESAFLDLVGQRLGRPMWAMLSDDGTSRPARLCVSLMSVQGKDLRKDALSAARDATSGGIDTLKIKIGRKGLWEDELEFVRVLRRELPKVALRVDANRAFSDAETPRVLEALAEAGVALCEEPCSFEGVMRLSESPLPLAFDESLQGPEGDARLSALGDKGLLGAVVLKPMTLGGVLRSREIARRARASGASAIVSHCLDGPIAHAAASALAVILPEPRSAAGLAAHHGLSVWPEVPLPTLAETQIVPSDEPGLGFPRGVVFG